MNIKRAVLMAGLVVAVAALAVPLIGMRTMASSSGSSMPPVRANLSAASVAVVPPVASKSGQKGVRLPNGQTAYEVDQAPDPAALGKISPETLSTLGMRRAANPELASKKIAEKIKKGAGSGDVGIMSGEPELLAGNAAFSDALITTEGGRDTQFDEIVMLADWDGREDCAADRSKKVDDFSFVAPDIDFTLTRAAISEHTIANGFRENVFYYGDSVGNVWVGVDTTGDGRVDVLTQINLPTVLNAFGTINSDDQVAVTGLAVNPVADLGSFGNVNGSYTPIFGGGAPGTSGVTGEILYVTYTDSESGLRLTSNGTPVRSAVLAFPVADFVSPASAPPGVLSAAGFPVTVGGAFGVAFSVFSNIAGCAVDDDGSVYFQQVDLVQFTGGNIIKIASEDDVAWQDRSLATSGFPTFTGIGNSTTTSVFAGGTIAGTASGPNGGGVSQINRFTNYSGTSTLWGDIVAINTGPCNVLYAAVSPSFGGGGVVDATQGLFPAPSAYTSGTPSMIISFADCSGALEICSSVATGSVTAFVGGGLPAADGVADKANASVTTVTPGVNNFRIFALGNGPDIRPAAGGTAVVPGTLSSVLKIDMQIDYANNAGIAVSGEGTVFVISGGEPAGVGKSPSPMVGEILCFEDNCPADRRADFVDLRSTGQLPNPPSSGANVGDGISDRFDHIFWQAPIDQITLTPTGISGLNFGFLRYTNRLAPVIPLGLNVTLGFTGGEQVLGDDTTTDTAPAGPCGDPSGEIIFEQLDPSHQVAGGDDQNFPFRGDDDNGAGSPPLSGPLSGGFEFIFGGPVGVHSTCPSCVWNGFFWNSNGNITFGNGDTDNTATVPEFRAGLPKIAPAWTDLNPNARAASLRDFPVMALGFVNINAFKIRMINVPQFSDEGCTGTASASGALIQSGLSNTFSITLYDDGTGVDENANQPLNPANPIGNNAVPFDLLEGPTDLRFTKVTQANVIVGCPPRREGTGQFIFTYCRMDLLGTPDFPVIAGYSIGGLTPTNPPGLCEVNLSVDAAAADNGAFGVLPDNQIAAIGCNCCIGEGTEPTIFELFEDGSGASTGSGGEITLAKPDFDLRFEGNDPALCTSTRQRDSNKGKVCFFGIGCSGPSPELCVLATPAAPVVVTPTTTGVVNAICQVPLNLLGCGFFPNEVTTICQGFEAETGVPLQRPGKTVTTVASLVCDTNGDGIPESVVPLTSVTPVSCNLITATIPVTANLPGTAFPAACCGGNAVVTVTTTFTVGDNNVFGLFTRASNCPIALGTRAPVVFSATPSTQTCNGLEDLLITGACFQFAGFDAGGHATTFTATSVFLQDKATGAIILPCAPFTIINNNLIDVNFCLTSASAGHSFLVFVVGPGGTSRNLTGPVTGQPGAPCPTTGNEAGIQVTFSCNAPGTPPPPGGTPVIATVTGCHLDRQDNGTFFLDVTGTNIKDGATATVGGVTPKKIKVVAVEPGTTNPTTLRLLKKVCNGLPGNVIITNTVPGGQPSAPFNCTERCPSN